MNFVNIDGFILRYFRQGRFTDFDCNAETVSKPQKWVNLISIKLNTDKLLYKQTIRTENKLWKYCQVKAELKLEIKQRMLELFCIRNFCIIYFFFSRLFNFPHCLSLKWKVLKLKFPAKANCMHTQKLKKTWSSFRLAFLDCSWITLLWYFSQCYKMTPWYAFVWARLDSFENSNKNQGTCLGKN